jgi:hypothetical protein
MFEAAWKKIGCAMPQRSERSFSDSHEQVKHARTKRLAPDKGHLEED